MIMFAILKFLLGVRLRSCSHAHIVIPDKLVLCNFDLFGNKADLLVVVL